MKADFKIITIKVEPHHHSERGVYTKSMVCKTNESVLEIKFALLLDAVKTVTMSALEDFEILRERFTEFMKDPNKFKTPVVFTLQDEDEALTFHFEKEEDSRPNMVFADGLELTRDESNWFSFEIQAGEKLQSRCDELMALDKEELVLRQILAGI
ncbi:hypothetical protein D3C78_20640 [compost metagenome]